ncbi:PIN domain-containing protein [Candidatus Micrarchaeota archaeon]|nr:PIN domain-containing protein [Candidatus Micrarchaeota archaeon]
MMDVIEVYIDTSVLLWGFNFPEGNSSKIISLLSLGKIKGYASETTLAEIGNFFDFNYDEITKHKAIADISANLKIIQISEITSEREKWLGTIKEKDLDHLATAKFLKLKYIIAVDRDFEPFPEYRTPKQFLKEIGYQYALTDY